MPIKQEKIPYWQKLQDPRWQKLRLEIFHRDSFQCRGCNDKEKRLEVHHLYYISGREPWEYPPAAFRTLCSECHQMEKECAKDEQPWEDLIELQTRVDFDHHVFSGPDQLAETIMWYCGKHGIHPVEFVKMFLLALHNEVITKEIFDSWKVAAREHYVGTEKEQQEALLAAGHSAMPIHEVTK